MADFRKWILALSVLALFAGVASAQSGFSIPFNAPPGRDSTAVTR